MSLDQTPRLNLPLIIANQAQKHISLNESLMRLDVLVQARILSRTISVQPTSPNDGDCYMIPMGASGTDWTALSADTLVRFESGFWESQIIPNGAVFYVEDERGYVLKTASGWARLETTMSGFDGLKQLGLGTTSDATNPFSAMLNNALLAASPVSGGGSGDVRLKLSKSTLSNTASVLFQDNFSGRAEVGLIGNDALGFKISTNGSSFTEVLTLTANGNVGIGTQNPATALSVNGVMTPQSDNTFSLGNASYRFTALYAVNGTSNTSDGREKRVVGRLDFAPQMVAQLEPVLYRWKTGIDWESPIHAGFIAQDIKACLEMCGTEFGVWGLDNPDDPNSRQWVRPDELIPVLWAAVKALTRRVEALEV